MAALSGCRWVSVGVRAQRGAVAVSVMQNNRPTGGKSHTSAATRSAGNSGPSVGEQRQRREGETARVIGVRRLAALSGSRPR